MVEESTAACHNLAQQAATLTELMGRFDVGGQNRPKLRAVPAAPAAGGSPARALAGRVKKAFAANANANAGAAADAEWQEF